MFDDGLGFSSRLFTHYVNKKKDMHANDFTLLSVIFEGQGTHMIGDMSFHESGGSLGVTFQGQKHDILTDEVGMSVMNVYIETDHFRLPNFSPQENQVLQQLLPLNVNHHFWGNRLLRIQFRDFAKVSKVLLMMNDEFLEKRVGWKTCARNLMDTFLQLCCREIIEQGGLDVQDQQQHNAVAEEVRYYLEDHYMDIMSTADLALKYRINKQYLCKCFKEYTGQTIIEYLTQVRINHAMFAIAHTNQSISTVATETGFQDLSFFNKKFKFLVGCTPRAYRQQKNR
ncbi:MAG: AraC family transcriptional regulator [Lentisphaeria bacterium]|nr:AraC family transcriptional regulator [Lentisphaeria bacterium]